MKDIGLLVLCESEERFHEIVEKIEKKPTSSNIQLWLETLLTIIRNPFDGLMFRREYEKCWNKKIKPSLESLDIIFPFILECKENTSFISLSILKEICLGDFNEKLKKKLKEKLKDIEVKDLRLQKKIRILLDEIEPENEANLGPRCTRSK